MKKIKGGFTLIEILVVIGIISIIIGMGATSYSSAQKKARDARRKADLQAIQNGLEQYYSVCGYLYPTMTSVVPTQIYCPTPSVAVIKEVPLDPLGNGYSVVAGDGSSYTICPPVVRTAGGYRMETTDCTSTNLDCCITNQQ